MYRDSTANFMPSTLKSMTFLTKARILFTPFCRHVFPRNSPLTASMIASNIPSVEEFPRGDSRSGHIDRLDNEKWKRPHSGRTLVPHFAKTLLSVNPTVAEQSISRPARYRVTFCLPHQGSRGISSIHSQVRINFHDHIESAGLPLSRQ